MLPESQWFRYPDAGALFDRIRALPAYVASDGLLAFQSAVNDGLAWLPGYRAVSIMSFLVFVAACGLVWRLIGSLAGFPGTADGRRHSVSVTRASTP